MRIHEIKPRFELTVEQASGFEKYGTVQDVRETIAARLLSGDPSAGDPNEEQRMFVAMLLRTMLRKTESAGSQ